MTEITALILAEHEAFGRRSLDLWGFRPHGASTAQAAAWRDCADRLQVHAAVEEEILYPALSKWASDQAPEETLDAIGDHYRIRDDIREAAATDDASLERWGAVLECRKANDEHLEEQERDIIPSFREHSDDELRSVLGREWLQFKPRHSGARGVPGDDVDSGAYVEENS
ncbi:MAG: hemerythrin domain-containing protein [Actinomycetota bacterium]|nr:hemerythrin domain-containing protein [Actinomycetota bacterium]